MLKVIAIFQLRSKNWLEEDEMDGKDGGKIPVNSILTLMMTIVEDSNRKRQINTLPALTKISLTNHPKKSYQPLLTFPQTKQDI